MINIKQSTTTLLQNIYKYLQKIIPKLDTTPSERRIEAEKILSTSIYIRDNYVVQLKKSLKSLKEKNC